MADERNKPQQPNGGSQDQHRQDPHRDLGVITVEAACRRCQNPSFGPTMTILRGRWSHAELFGMDAGELLKMPDVPGTHITLDARRRTGKIWDPLHNDEELRRRAFAVYKSTQRQECGLKPDKDYADMTDGDIKTWLREIRKMLDAKMVVLAPGSAQVPSMKDIMALPGKTRQEFFNNSPRAIRYLEDTQEYKDRMLQQA